MRKRVVIVGAGGFGRGVEGWLRSSRNYLQRNTIDEIAFLDDASNASVGSTPHLGAIRDYEPEERDELICAIGDPIARQTIVANLVRRGARFHTYVDERAVVGARVRIGEGAVVCPGAVISADVVIGSQSHVNFNCSVGHDVTLGPFVTLSPMVNLMGGVDVGASAFLGGSAVVLPRLKVGERAVIGAAAVVVRDLEGGKTVVGNPAGDIGAHARNSPNPDSGSAGSDE